MRTLLLIIPLLLLCPAQVRANACSTGTLDIVASSDTPFVLPTFNVGQMVKLEAVPTGITMTSLTWTIDGPLIKDYNERVGEASTGPLPWSTSPLTSADLSASPVTFYWKPSSSQIFPLNGGPVSRNVTLTAVVAGTTCTVAKTYSVERNNTDARKQANDFYTSNHQVATETVPGKGIVIDDHLDWHDFPATRLSGNPDDFFIFHRSFIARFNSWRAQFGYGPVVPWYPGTPYPPGIDDVAYAVRDAAFSTDQNQLFRPFTIAGGNADPFLGPIAQQRLADFADANSLDGAFEGSYHGFVHCNVGTGTLPTGGVSFVDPLRGTMVFGDMCNFSSPKDPIFYPWHDFVDLVYTNLCAVKGLACPGTPAPATDVWMADNAADLAANGIVPSPPPHYISPDIWNRTSPVTCTPPTVGTGVIRNCGSSADHENPVAGRTNYLYAMLRNDRSAATDAVYTEVAVYIANASTGLAWPTNFGGGAAGIPLDETRHLITLYLPAGQTTAIGPLPWTPPNPSPSDHWCLYIRVLNVQDTIGTETADIDANTGGSNSIAWRNLKIVTAAGMMKKWPFQGFDGLAAFLIRNIHTDATPIDLSIYVSEGIAKHGTVRLQLSPKLASLVVRSKAKIEGFRRPKNWEATRATPYVTLTVLGQRAVIRGIILKPGEAMPVAVDVAHQKLGPGTIVVEQGSDGKVDGGVVLQVGKPHEIQYKPDK
jgi:hypothetical protein